MTKKRYYEYKDNGSNKFWEIYKKGNMITTRWGKIGSNGNILTKDYGDDAISIYYKLIKSKTKKGYKLSIDEKKSIFTNISINTIIGSPEKIYIDGIKFFKKLN